MTDSRGSLDLLAEVAAVRSGPSLSWFGQRVLPGALRARIRYAPASLERRFVADLQRWLYGHYYGCGEPVRDPAIARTGLLPASRMPFIESLIRANHGHGTWDPGWRVVGSDSGSVLVERDSIRARAARALVHPSDREQMRNGLPVRLRLGPSLSESSPGFYVAVGDAELGTGDPSLIRIYWNIGAGGASSLLRLITKRWNERGHPFRLKVVSDPAGYDRRDAAVLYIPEASYEVCVGDLEWVYRSVRGELRYGVPALVHELAFGVGLAEDPRTGESFGMSRCAVLAEGLMAAMERRSARDRAQALRRALASHGVSPDEPHKRPGSEAQYPRWDRIVGQGGRLRAVRRPSQETDVRRLRKAAAAIARHLVETGIRHERACTWVGRRSQDHMADTAPRWETLGPDLYGGTSGVGLFLAHAFRLDREPRTIEVALAAVHYALGQLESIPPRRRHGLYAGWPGIALAAWQVGDIAGSRSLKHEAHSLLRRVLGEPVPEEPDLMSGGAGAIVAACWLAARSGDRSLIEGAARLGRAIRSRAVRSAGTLAWKSPTSKSARPLTGLSHGASGIAWAFLELTRRTGIESFRDAAARAMAYERRALDRSRGNWEDFRILNRRRLPSRHATAWCHGAPGIALVRIRSNDLRAEPKTIREAEMALRTTREHLEAALRSPDSDLCLCHGILGNADVLLHGAARRGPLASELIATARRAVAYALRKQGKANAAPFEGTIESEAPGLMLGLAGVGMQYLRAALPGTESILFPACDPPRTRAPTGRSR